MKVVTGGDSLDWPRIAFVKLRAFRILWHMTRTESAFLDLCTPVLVDPDIPGNLR